jgi:hypothetical protein
MDLNQIIEDIERKSDEIPFDKSTFQIQVFDQIHETDTRNYRHLLLQANRKINALKECDFRRQKIVLELEFKRKQLFRLDDDLKAFFSKSPDEKYDTLKFNKDNLEIEIFEKEYYLSQEEKFIKDAIIELTYFNELLKNYPEFTREEFENGEAEYWKKRFIHEAGLQYTSNGRIESELLKQLENIKIMVGFDNEKKQIIFYEKNDKEQIQ